jgi:hypothetical protein
VYFLYRAAGEKLWPATDAHLFAPLWLVALLLPALLISSLGHMRARSICLWGCVAAILLAALAYYDVWRMDLSSYASLADQADGRRLFPAAQMMFGTIASFSILQALILAAVEDRKPIASYASYFEVAWKLAVQVIFTAIFLGLLVMILELGATLFMLVKLNFLQILLTKEWFTMPVATFAFSFAFHLTDIRPNIVKGIRALLLVLMSWLLPLAVLIIGGFLLSTLATGLAPLWATRHASSVLLGAAAILVVLINAAYQNGLSGAEVAPVLRISARIASVLLLPIVLLTIYALGLRIHDHGWSNGRVVAASYILVAICYAIGYCWAALSRGVWLRRIANTNIVAAIGIVAIKLLMLSPLLDPARISTDSQLRQLAGGHIAAKDFDFDFLRFQGARYGIEALRSLTTFAATSVAGTDAELIRDTAKQILEKKDHWDNSKLDAAELNRNIKVFPASEALPESFLKQAWTSDKLRDMPGLPNCLRQTDSICHAYFVDFSGAGKKSILLFGEVYGDPALFEQGQDQSWSLTGTLPDLSDECKAALRHSLENGGASFAASRWKDIDLNGHRVRVQPADHSDCGDGTR